MNVSLWPRATHPTDSSTGPSSDASLRLHWDALKWVHDAERCSFVFSVFSRARTMTFNLFLYIEDWAAAGKFSIPLGTAQCATAEGGIEVMLRLRPWTEIPGTVKTIIAGNVCTVCKSSQNVCEHWTSYQSKLQILNQIIKKMQSSAYFMWKAHILKVKTSYSQLSWSLSFFEWFFLLFWNTINSDLFLFLFSAFYYCIFYFFIFFLLPREWSGGGMYNF